MGEMQHIAIPIYRNRHGWFTCRLSSEFSCPFLGFRKFGQVPVCMKGRDHDIDYYNSDPFAYIEPDCGLVEKLIEPIPTVDISKYSE